MSDWISDDGSYFGEEENTYKGVRFCNDCNNMLHPRDADGKLAFECVSDGCTFKTIINENTNPIENLVSRKRFQQEDKDALIDRDFT